MRKIFALLLVGILLALAACGSKKSQAAIDAENAIRAIGEVTLGKEDAIKNAEKLLSVLTEAEKAQVDNRLDLVNAREALDKLIEKKQTVNLNADNAKNYFKVTVTEEGGKAYYSKNSQFFSETYKGEGYLIVEISATKAGSYENVVVDVDLELNAGGGDGEFSDGYGWEFSYGGKQRVWENGNKDACFIKRISVHLDQFGKGTAKEKVEINASRPTYSIRGGMSEDLSDLINSAKIVGAKGTVKLAP